MNKIKTYIKLLIKCVYINSYKKLVLGNRSGIGAFSKVLFSSEVGKCEDQSIEIGDFAGVGRFCELHVWDNNHILIKDYSTLNDNCKLLGDVTIERNCLLGSNIFAGSGNHYALIKPTWLIRDQDSMILSSKKGRDEHSNPIHIEEDCWIGFGVFIKRGIKIGRGAIIGANSVISKDIPPYSIQAGAPCKEIKQRVNFNPPNEISCYNDDHLPYFYRGFIQKRELLEDSRKLAQIFSYNESIVILKNEIDFKEINIKGRKNKDYKSVELVISLQGQLEWNIKIQSDTFDLKLTKEQANKSLSENSKKLYTSVGGQLQQYKVLTTYSANIDHKQILYGIETIKIN